MTKEIRFCLKPDDGLVAFDQAILTCRRGNCPPAGGDVRELYRQAPRSALSNEPSPCHCGSWPRPRVRVVDHHALCVRQAAVPHRGVYGRIDAFRQGIANHHHYGNQRIRCYQPSPIRAVRSIRPVLTTTPSTILGPRILTPSAVTHNHRDARSGRSSRTAGVNVCGLDRRVELHRIAALLARPIARALAAAERHVIVDAGRR